MSKIGFIYKIAHNDPEIKEIYIGSTSNLKKRKYDHKHRCNNVKAGETNMRVYQFIRSNGGFSNFDIFQIEEVKYNTAYELHSRERYYIELLNPSLNKYIPNRTDKEYYEDNKEEICEKVNKYRRENLDKVKIQQHKKYEKNKIHLLEQMRRKIDCSCGSNFSIYQKMRHEKTQKHINYIASLPVDIM